MWTVENKPCPHTVQQHKLFQPVEWLIASGILYYNYRISHWYYGCFIFIYFFIYRLAAPLQPGQPQMSQSMSGANNSGGGGGGGVGSQHCQLGGSSPLVMPVFPLRTSHSANAPHYSPYSPSR